MTVISMDHVEEVEIPEETKGTLVKTELLPEGTIQVRYINGCGPYGYRVRYVDGRQKWEYLGRCADEVAAGSYSPRAPLEFKRRPDWIYKADSDIQRAPRRKKKSSNQQPAIRKKRAHTIKERVYSILVDNLFLSSRQLIDQFGFNEKGIYGVLRELRNEGIASRLGKRGNGMYCLSQRINEARLSFKQLEVKKRSSQPHRTKSISTELIKSTLEDLIQENLDRCGGACHININRLRKGIIKRIGPRSREQLKQLIIQLLESDPRAALWDSGSPDSQIQLNQVYTFRDENLISTHKNAKVSREPSIRERILDLFTDEIVLTAETIARNLQVKRQRVSQILRQFVLESKLVRVERGFYCVPRREDSAREVIETLRNPVTLEQIQRVLSVEAPLAPGEIAKQLGTRFAFVSKALNRFANEKRVVRIARGFYCLPGQNKQCRHRIHDHNPLAKRIKETLSHEYPQKPLQIAESLGAPRSTVNRLLRDLVKKGVFARIGYGLYCLPSQVDSVSGKLEDVLEKHDERKPRKKKAMSNPTVADTAFQLIRLLMDSKAISIRDLSHVSSASNHTLKSTIDRLVDRHVLTKNERNLVSIAPQDAPEKIETLQLLAESESWTEVIHELIIAYMEKYRTDTGHDVQWLHRIRRFVTSQLYFLYPAESQNAFNDAIDSLCIEGIFTKIDESAFRFNL